MPDRFFRADDENPDGRNFWRSARYHEPGRKDSRRIRAWTRLEHSTRPVPNFQPDRTVLAICQNPIGWAAEQRTDLLRLLPSKIKVITISQLYSARVLSIDGALLARHVCSISNLDDLLAAGDPRVVPLMYDCNTTRRRYYYFATKFCSRHNRLAYSLWDYNVDEAL